MNTDQVPKVRLSQIFSYGSGNMGLNLFFGAISTYLLYFYTDVAGLTTAAAGTLIFLVKLINLVVNPFMGIIIDRSRSRWGKFRPYLLFGSVPLAIIGVLTFSVPDLDGSGKLVYAYITYLLFNLAYAVVNVPYSSMLANMSNNYFERSRISSIKVFLGQFGGLIVGVATLPLVHKFASEAVGFRIVFSVFACILVIAMLITFFGTRERTQQVSDSATSISSNAAPKKVPVGTTLKALTRNKYLIILLGFILLSMTAQTTMSSVAVYFFKYNFGKPALFSLYSLIGFSSLILFVLLNPIFVRKMGKRNVGILSQLIVIIGMTCFYMFHDNLAQVFIFGAISFAGMGLSAPLLWSMIPDTIEYGEWKSGVRSEGTVYSSFIFAQLAAAAIGSKVSGDLLSWFGYVPNAVQTPTALHGILVMMTVIPITAAAIGIVILSFYKLDNKTFSSMVQEIKARGTHRGIAQ
ncbi:MFS transporter [Paenibacillus aceris]|uniref:Sugar (Glycoside-pentoside-hexuronide) transporter n=1 Tax=Paenibacillus aceris TaxID=869555 RepID=A0ABS4I219_9BACL|nr:glycoside-pentoside-hexuronide (GPH):cation symporter [Paenibacillus aceris]MBP1964972.1 sugar (glycoside-pentoside-hexuronide) transporter [Paenibacillus aceris]NHW35633.1 MFS transporter [Paenibacillus aceris]